ncbi:MAG TPA: hypothetical protein EYQ11_01845 [Candidatus Poseidoniales archaeon]|nr:MAG: hypothetical protein CXT66_05265 [Euryarchaeota archaeon]HIG33610.1 hypothetical protein [Candidatus Poseidoniales archaeon]HIL67342.1 hypothetical protein [Candidatus Poseidoniales archaeon]
MGALSGVSNRRLNIVISAWICIALGTSLLLYDNSMFSLSLSAPLSIGGVILLILGLFMSDEDGKTTIRDDSWTPSASIMPDVGRPMFRIDTTLDEPIRTSILCGRCAIIEWVDGKKPSSFTCPSCGTELWFSEEE